MDLRRMGKMVREERAIKDRYLKDLFTNNTAVQFKSIDNNNRIAIFHKCTRESHKYQISYFDEKGAEMDFRRNSIDEIVEEFSKCHLRYSRKDDAVSFTYELMEVIQ